MCHGAHAEVRGQSALSSHHVNPKGLIQIIRLSGKYPHPMNHLAGPDSLCF